MSSRTGNTQPQKRKRASENSSKNEPAAKKVRSNKSAKLEKESSSNKRKSSKAARKANLPNDENRSNFSSDSEINNNSSTAGPCTPTRSIKLEKLSLDRTGPADLCSAKITNSSNSHLLRDLRVVLDRTVVDDYFRQRLLPENRKPRRRARRSRAKATDHRGQKTLDQYFDAAPTIDGGALLPVKQEDSVLRQLLTEDGFPEHGEASVLGKRLAADAVKSGRVNVSMKALEMLCDVRVSLGKLQPDCTLKIGNNAIFTETNALKKLTFYDPGVCIKTEICEEVDEGLARMKIEDVDERSMKMEVSDEFFDEGNLPWAEAAPKAEESPVMKITDAISALSDDYVLAFYDSRPDVPMEEAVPENHIALKGPEAFYLVNTVSAGSSFNSSKTNWPVGDESGIFMSDDSANFNELSGKVGDNSSFNGLLLEN